MYDINLKPPIYDPVAVQPMRDELLYVGFEELQNPQAADEALSASDNEFDVWFKQSLSECHGIDFDKPLPGSPPELIINEVK